MRKSNWTVNVIIENDSSYIKERDIAEDLVKYIKKWLRDHKVTGIAVAKLERKAKPRPVNYEKPL